jgi:hypothetical protein
VRGGQLSFTQNFTVDFPYQFKVTIQLETGVRLDIRHSPFKIAPALIA